MISSTPALSSSLAGTPLASSAWKAWSIQLSTCAWLAYCAGPGGCVLPPELEPPPLRDAVAATVMRGAVVRRATATRPEVCVACGGVTLP